MQRSIGYNLSLWSLEKGRRNNRKLIVIALEKPQRASISLLMRKYNGNYWRSRRSNSYEPNFSRRKTVSCDNTERLRLDVKAEGRSKARMSKCSWITTSSLTKEEERSVRCPSGYLGRNSKSHPLSSIRKSRRSLAIPTIALKKKARILSKDMILWRWTSSPRGRRRSSSSPVSLLSEKSTSSV